MLKSYKVVKISFQDHSGNLEGMAEPYMFLAIGVILKEDEYGYTLGHWTRLNNFENNEIGEITSYVAKVKGLKIKTLCSIALRNK